MQAGGGHGREGEDEASNNIAGSASRCERLGRPEEELGWLDPRQHCLESVWWGTGPTSEIVLWLLCRGERRDLDLISIQRSCPDFRSTLGDCSPRAAFPPGTRETRTRVQPYPPGIPNKGTVYCHYYPGAPSRASSGYPRRSSPLHVRVGRQADLYLRTRQPRRFLSGAARQQRSPSAIEVPARIPHVKRLGVLSRASGQNVMYLRVAKDTTACCISESYTVELKSHENDFRSQKLEHLGRARIDESMHFPPQNPIWRQRQCIAAGPWYPTGPRFLCFMQYGREERARVPVSCGRATRPSARWPAAAARPARSPAERALAMSTRTAPDPDRVGS